eukprot:m.143592 g.143592  ORF g.143592 m.143592 type:complete len:715 (+) comp14901_c0_seq4:288-2432(+)
MANYMEQIRRSKQQRDLMLASMGPVDANGYAMPVACGYSDTNTGDELPYRIPGEQESDDEGRHYYHTIRQPEDPGAGAAQYPNLGDRRGMAKPYERLPSADLANPNVVPYEMTLPMGFPADDPEALEATYGNLPSNVDGQYDNLNNQSARQNGLLGAPPLDAHTVSAALGAITMTSSNDQDGEYDNLPGQKPRSASMSAIDSSSTSRHPTYPPIESAVPPVDARPLPVIPETSSKKNNVEPNVGFKSTNLMSDAWYIGKLDRDEARAKVMPGPQGTFLVRDSSDGKLFVLGLKTGNDYTQYRILKNPDGTLNVGNDQFDTLDDCVNQMRETPIVHETVEGNILISPENPVEGCWFHISAARRIARECEFDEPIDTCAWYAGDFTRETADAAVRTAFPGSFLVRPASEKDKFVLVVNEGGAVGNFVMHQEGPSQLRLGADVNSHRFPTLASAVHSLRQHHVVGTSSKQVSIKSPVVGLGIHPQEMQRIVDLSTEKLKTQISTLKKRLSLSDMAESSGIFPAQELTSASSGKPKDALLDVMTATPRTKPQPTRDQLLSVMATQQKTPQGQQTQQATTRAPLTQPLQRPPPQQSRMPPQQHTRPPPQQQQHLRQQPHSFRPPAAKPQFAQQQMFRAAPRFAPRQTIDTRPLVRPNHMPAGRAPPRSRSHSHHVGPHQQGPRAGIPLSQIKRPTQADRQRLAAKQTKQLPGVLPDQDI